LPLFGVAVVVSSPEHRGAADPHDVAEQAAVVRCAASGSGRWGRSAGRGHWRTGRVERPNEDTRTIPREFTVEAIAAASVDAFAPYQAFHTSGEPYRSLSRNNPWTRVPGPKDELEWGKGWYYDTTVARKHPHWRDIELPQATKDIAQLRRDFYEWGYDARARCRSSGAVDRDAAG